MGNEIVIKVNGVEIRGCTGLEYTGIKNDAIIQSQVREELIFKIRNVSRKSDAEIKDIVEQLPISLSQIYNFYLKFGRFPTYQEGVDFDYSYNQNP